MTAALRSVLVLTLSPYSERGGTKIGAIKVGVSESTQARMKFCLVDRLLTSSQIVIHQRTRISQ